MNKFEINKENAIALAKELDINVSFNSSEPGVTIGSELRELTDFFPELKSLNCGRFIVKEEGTLSDIAEQMLITIHKETPIKNRNVIGSKIYDKNNFFNAA